jgi:hypothetical protein
MVQLPPQAQHMALQLVNDMPHCLVLCDHIDQLALQGVHLLVHPVVAGLESVIFLQRNAANRHTCCGHAPQTQQPLQCGLAK